MRDADPGRAEAGDLVVVEMDAVRDPGSRAEPARLLRRSTERLPNVCIRVCVLVRRLAEVAMQAGAVAFGELRRFRQHALRHGERRARRERDADHRAGPRIVEQLRGPARCPRGSRRNPARSSSGCRPPSFSEMPIDPRVNVMRRPSFLRLLDLDVDRVLETRRKEIVVVGRRRAAGQEKFDHRHAGGDAQRLGRHAVPDALHRHEPGNEVAPEAGRMGAGQRLVEVMVRVDETRQHDMARGVESRAPWLGRAFGRAERIRRSATRRRRFRAPRPARGSRAGP